MVKAINGTLKALGEVLRRNRGMRVSLALALAIIVCTVGIGVAASTMLPHGETAGGEERQEQEEPREQEAAFEHHEYSGDEQAVLDTLMSCSWEGRDGSVYNFRGDYAEVTSTSGTRRVGVEIRNANPGEASTQTIEEAGQQNTVATVSTTFVLVWDGETYPCEMTSVTSSDGASYALASEPLGDLTGTTASASLEILDEPSGLDEATLGHRDELEEALVSWCSSHAPSATRATWSGSVTRDWVSKTLSTTLTLNDSSSTRVTATMDVDSGTFTIQK